MGDIDHVVYFSSLGPTYDDRIKPDIVAPGAGLISARAAKQGSKDKTCKTTWKQGTSMSSPAALGAAAMMRQYFQDPDGIFWTKVCRPRSDKMCRSFTPSGMLLKALLLHSGEAMSLYDHISDDEEVELGGTKPDMYQGYGRVQLSNVLPLPGETDFQLSVRDVKCINEGNSWSHKFKVTSSTQPLVVTISWYDAPATSGAAKALMNDLDLVLVRPNGKKKLFGNYRSKRDHVNNNERITVNEPDTGKYKVVVEANALPVAGEQCFSFVLTYSGPPL